MVGSRTSDGLLGSYVVGSPHHGGWLLRFGWRVLEEFRQPHIEDFDDTLRVDEKICRFDIPVRNSFFVSMLKPSRGLKDIFTSDVDWKTAACLNQQLLESSTLNVFQDEEM